MEGERPARPTWYKKISWGIRLKGDPIPNFPVSMQDLLESNEPPSTDALDFVANYRSSAQASLHTAQELRCGQEIRDEELLLEKRVHLANIILSPLRHIPNEIIQEILDFAMQDWHPFHHPLNSICSRWRTVLRSMPRHRANVCLAVQSASFQESLGELEKAVQNTSDYPLWIRLKDPDTPKPSPWDSFFEDRSIMERVTCLWITTKDLPLVENVKDSKYAALPCLETLVLREAAWKMDYDIDFSDEFMNQYPTQDGRLLELLAGSPQLRRVSLGQLSTKSVNSPDETAFWKNLTHIFLQPTFSVHGWRTLMRECESLIVGYFFITQMWEEHDGRDSPPNYFACDRVEDMTIALVDFVDENSLDALGALDFPSLRSFAVHVNGRWHTDFEARDLTEDMPLLRKLGIPHTWNMNKKAEFKFINSFPFLTDIEVGVTVAQTERMLKFFTIPDIHQTGNSNTASMRCSGLGDDSSEKSKAAIVAVKQSGAGDDVQGSDEELHEEDHEESDEDEEESDEDEDDSDDDSESDDDEGEDEEQETKTKPKRLRQCRSKVLQAITIEIHDWDTEYLSIRHGEAFVRMVQSRFRTSEASSSAAASSLRFASIRFLQSSKTKNRRTKRRRTDGIFAYIHRALRPLVESGLHLETVFASRSLSSYAEKWNYALSKYDSS